MKKRIDLMVDIETLGLGLDSTIIQIACVPFCLEWGLVLRNNTFNQSVALDKIEVNGDGSTINFWIKNNLEVFNSITNGVFTEKEIVKNFFDYVNGYVVKNPDHDVYLWANGLLFDNAKLLHFAKKNGIESKIKYNRHLDMKSYLHALAIKQGKDLYDLYDEFYEVAYKYNVEVNVSHNALEDAISQATLLIHATKN